MADNTNLKDELPNTNDTKQEEFSPLPFTFKWTYRGKTRYSDPGRVLKVFRAKLGSEMDARIDDAVNKDDFEQMEVVQDAVATAFQFQKFNPETGEGLTELECISLLGEFLMFTDLEKKSTPESQDLPQSTESTHSDSQETTPRKESPSDSN